MRARPLLTPIAAAGLIALGGCGDAVTEPAALVPAGELEAALSIAARLPTFTSLAGEALTRGRAAPGGGRNGAGDAAARLGAALALAARADSLEDEAEARRLRAEAYASGLVPLAELLDPAAVEEARGALGFWLEVAEGLVGGAELPPVRDALLDARTLLGRSRAASVLGDDVAAVSALVGAADRLAGTTPRAVLRRLLPELEARLAARQRSGDTTRVADLRRADRLLRGARKAEAAGLYVLGLRRAYYARQILHEAAATPR